jgi:hypothetical protein
MTRLSRFLLAILLVVFAVASFGLYERQQTAPAPKTIYSQVATTSGGERLFGLQYVSGPIHSAYLYEAGLLGTTPVDDVDYQVPYGAQELVTLPGFKTDTYVHRYTSFIPGSGTISCWFVVANGGHFCFLHLSISNLGATRNRIKPPLFPVAPLKTATRKLSGDELTALAAMAQQPASTLPTASVFHGGFVVGRSGWPTNPIYGNGTAGPSNAHLCLLLDQAAANWFLAILDGRHKPPKPKTFPLKFWQGYTIEHHKHSVAAYHKHKLTRIARKWWTHYRKYRGAVSKRYYGVTRTRKEAFYAWRFRCAKAWVWSKSIKFQKARCLK